jgi:transcriptional regulator with XRE-family HTH domain
MGPRPGAVARAGRRAGILSDVNGSAIAPRLKAARIDAKVRVNELARRMGVRPSTVCRIEAGQNALLESTVQRYAAALGLALEVRLVPSAEVAT